MSRKSGPRKQKTKLALLWVDERFEVPIQTSPLARTPMVAAPRSIILLEPARRGKQRPAVAKR